VENGEIIHISCDGRTLVPIERRCGLGEVTAGGVEAMAWTPAMRWSVLRSDNKRRVAADLGCHFCFGTGSDWSDAV